MEGGGVRETYEGTLEDVDGGGGGEEERELGVVGMRVQHTHDGPVHTSQCMLALHGANPKLEPRGEERIHQRA
jgi:hypothetical protein